MFKIRKYYIYVAFIFLLLFIIKKHYDIESRKKYTIKKSPIHGVGVFSTTPIAKDEIIECAIIMNDDNFVITPKFGVFINHSNKIDNADLILIDNAYYVKATKFIPINTEILVNYDGDTIPSFISGSKPNYL